MSNKPINDLQRISAVLDAGPADQTQTLILVGLIDRMDENGVCWPANADTAHRARLHSDRSARRNTAALENEHWLTRHVRYSDQSNLIVVNVEKIDALVIAQRKAETHDNGYDRTPMTGHVIHRPDTHDRSDRSPMTARPDTHDLLTTQEPLKEPRPRRSRPGTQRDLVAVSVDPPGMEITEWEADEFDPAMAMGLISNLADAKALA